MPYVRGESLRERLGQGPVPLAEAMAILRQGPGIPAERLAAIMSPFEQGTNGLTRVDAGMGLGLSTARVLCQQLGLGLSAASTVGQGTVFSITFGPTVVQA